MVLDAIVGFGIGPVPPLAVDTPPVPAMVAWMLFDTAGKSALTGRQKLFEVRRTEDDISFLRNYLTVELMEQLELFTYGRPCTHPPGQRCVHCQHVVITSRDQETILEALLAPRYNYGVPRIVIRDVVNNALYL